MALSEEQLLSIRELAGHLPWNAVWADEHPGEPWEGGVHFVLQDAPSRNFSEWHQRKLIEGIRQQMGQVEFFVENDEDMTDDELSRMTLIGNLRPVS